MVDCIGDNCPRPQMFTRNALGKARQGEVIEVKVDNPTSPVSGRDSRELSRHEYIALDDDVRRFFESGPVVRLDYPESFEIVTHPWAAYWAP